MTTTTTSTAQATAPQVELIRRLLAEHEVPLGLAVAIDEAIDHGTLTRAAASRAIDKVQTFPRKDGLDGPPASDAQVGFLERLLVEREIPADFAAKVRTAIDATKVTKAMARTAIDYMLDKPQRPTAERVQLTSAVPDGYYALGTEREPRRFKVRTGRNRTFLDEMNAHGGWEWAPKASIPHILAEIAKNPAGAAELYAKTTNRCAACGRPLRVPVSVHRGYGPDCAKSRGLA